jgi:hypothetical protein
MFFYVYQDYFVSRENAGQCTIATRGALAHTRQHFLRNEAKKSFVFIEGQNGMERHTNRGATLAGVWRELPARPFLDSRREPRVHFTKRTQQVFCYQ